MTLNERISELSRLRGDGGIDENAYFDRIDEIVRKPLERLILARSFYRLGPESIHDLVQETLIRLLIAVRGGLDFSDSSMIPWLRKVAERLMIDRWRRVQNVAAFPATDEDLMYYKEPPDHLLRKSVQSVLGTLSWRRRCVASMWVTDGYTQAEIADFLGVTPETVSNDVKMVKRAFRQDETISSIMEK